MNMTTRVVLRHFLLKLRKPLNEPKVLQLDPFFQTFFIKSELEDIVRSMYDVKTLKELDLDGMSKEELLATIGDDAIVLGYFLDRWDNEICHAVRVTSESVRDTLRQLNLHTHYLRYKEISQWDSYDMSNYRALQLKAGKICRVFGIYDASISQEEIDSVTSPPHRFYESDELAEIARQEMIARDHFHQEDIHILSLYASK